MSKISYISDNKKFYRASLKIGNYERVFSASCIAWLFAILGGPFYLFIVSLITNNSSSLVSSWVGETPLELITSYGTLLLSFFFMASFFLLPIVLFSWALEVYFSKLIRNNPLLCIFLTLCVSFAFFFPLFSVQLSNGRYDFTLFIVCMLTAAVYIALYIWSLRRHSLKV